MFRARAHASTHSSLIAQQSGVSDEHTAAMAEEAAEPQMETGADFTSATVATMSMTFDERLLQDNERRAQARQLNLQFW